MELMQHEHERHCCSTLFNRKRVQLNFNTTELAKKKTTSNNLKMNRTSLEGGKSTGGHEPNKTQSLVMCKTLHF